MEAFLGQIFLWPLSWAPEGTAFCDGSSLPIRDNEALYALLGTTYGGDGQTYFKLPDLRGRIPIGAGQSANGLIPLGASGGQTAVMTALRPHAHGLGSATAASTLKVDTSHVGQAVSPAPGSCLTASPGSGTMAAAIYAQTAPTTTVDVTGVGTSLTGVTDMSGPAGPQDVTTPRSVVNPYVGVQYIIFTQGQFPVRD